MPAKSNCCGAWAAELGQQLAPARCSHSQRHMAAHAARAAACALPALAPRAALPLRGILQHRSLIMPTHLLCACRLLDGVSGVTLIDRFDCDDFPTRFAAQIKNFDDEG